MQTVIASCANRDDAPDFWDMDTMARLYQGVVLAPLPLEKDEHLETGYEALEDKLTEFALERLDTKINGLGDDLAGQLAKFVLIQVLDEQWRSYRRRAGNSGRAYFSGTFEVPVEQVHTVRVVHFGLGDQRALSNG